MTDRGRQLRIEGLTKRFGTVVAVDSLDLLVEPGLLVALLGPSGCGKTTTLRAIAGFEAPDEGRIMIGDRDVSRLSPDRRGLGMVFQNYSLFPHMTVAENIAFGLKMKRTPAGEIVDRVREMLDLVQLPNFEDRYPNQLSGGQQQRVALARSLVTNPSVLLLDEPLGALDKNLRETMQFELRRIQHTLGITTILVTHDQEEALTLSDRVVVMNQGRILQAGTPEEVYEFPTSRFVSEFLGTSNLFDGVLGEGVGSDRREFVIGSGGHRHAVEVASGAGQRASGPATLALRPEKVVLQEAAPAGVNHVPVEIAGHVFRGSYHAYEVRMAGRTEPILVYDQARSRTQARRFAPGDRVLLTWRAEDGVLLEG
ncbi:MAG: polyamine ABC transporter ATP-binding protein [Rhizobiales bacterium]|nr:polyamine ABC transporter ATP-binding protein [Hyphomicrobiales bacterium]